MILILKFSKWNCQIQISNPKQMTFRRHFLHDWKERQERQKDGKKLHSDLQKLHF